MFLLVIYAGLLHAAGTPRTALSCKVTPPVIEVGSFYEGASVRVEGVAAPRSRLIVTVAGSDREERFNQKARLGPVWMSAGHVRISGAPSLFLQFSTDPVPSVEGRCFDETSIAARMRIDPPTAGAAALRASFFALKKSDGTYVFSDRGVAIDEAGAYHVDFRWPKKAPPAEYQLHVYEVRGGAVTAEACAALSVVRTGFPAWLADLAESRASMYGVAAVLIGAFAGFCIDLLTTRIFGKKRPPAH